MGQRDSNLRKLPWPSLGCIQEIGKSSLAETWWGNSAKWLGNMYCRALSIEMIDSNSNRK